MRSSSFQGEDTESTEHPAINGTERTRGAALIPRAIYNSAPGWFDAWLKAFEEQSTSKIQPPASCDLCGYPVMTGSRSRYGGRAVGSLDIALAGIVKEESTALSANASTWHALDAESSTECLQAGRATLRIPQGTGWIRTESGGAQIQTRALCRIKQYRSRDYRLPVESAQEVEGSLPLSLNGCSTLGMPDMRLKVFAAFPLQPFPREFFWSFNNRERPRH